MPISIVLLVALAVFIIAGFRIAQEYERGVVFRLGRLRGVRGPGLYWIIPLIERQRTLDMRTRTVAVEQQETITRDSVTVRIDAVLWYRIFDPKKAVIFVENYRAAVYQVALTSLRNIIGQHGLDEVLKERNTINETLRDIVDAATAAWGINIEMVEMKDVEIPEAMQRAMAREAEAVREKRARLIKADAEAEASQKLADAAKAMAESPAALELRRMQMVSEIGAENNSTTIILMPSEIVSAMSSAAKALSRAA
ncbi:MAG TPA: SPFH domain-containing protein [Stellaceae bacterium]|nr:SPFH domain-containing protein [Stellaceae bacterium]